jgi:UDP-2,3-diacylglucosamine pyrophosphatase LpxH
MSVDGNAKGLERLGTDPPAHVLVASDLHLGRGWDPVTATCIATENFLADHAFAAWLEHYAAAAAETLLILNGDIFDVLRITDIPRSDEDFERWARWLDRLGAPRDVAALREDIDKSERRYGLKTHDHKTVWKLLLTVDGHPRVLAALAAWVSRGGRVLFITGNHDVELYWPLVRSAIRRELADRGAGDEAEVGDRVLFEQEHVVIDNLYVEHGHRFERLTRVEGPPELPRDPGDEGQINLPLGSFVNRYVINKVEALDPFIDNVKPVQDALMRLARQRPLKILSTYLGAWRFLGMMVAKRGLHHSTVAIAAALVLPPILIPVALVLFTPIKDTVLGFLPDSVGTAVTIVLGVVASGVVPYVAGVLGDVLKRIRRSRPVTDHQLDAARELVNTELRDCPRRRKYVCMGHSHVSAVRRLDADGDHVYLNTGTWIALWPDDRPDLIGRTVYTYAAFDAGGDGDGYVARALEWDEHADRPRPATILVPAAA